jgi:hypothetical protein
MAFPPYLSEEQAMTKILASQNACRILEVGPALANRMGVSALAICRLERQERPVPEIPPYVLTERGALIAREVRAVAEIFAAIRALMDP